MIAAGAAIGAVSLFVETKQEAMTHRCSEVGYQVPTFTRSCFPSDLLQRWLFHLSVSDPTLPAPPAPQIPRHFSVIGFSLPEHVLTEATFPGGLPFPEAGVRAPAPQEASLGGSAAER